MLNAKPKSQMQDVDGQNLAHVIVQALNGRPDGDCVLDGTRRLSRADLRVASEDLAQTLRASGISKGEPVCIEVAHSFDLIVSLCAVLLADGIAVPVDPDLSAERRSAILEDVAPRLVVKAGLDGQGPDVLSYDRMPDTAPGLAFLVYTSGSSGRPKGVEIGHAGYVGRLQHITQNNPPQPNDIDLLWTPSSFIGMLDEVFFPLLLGVPIVVAPATVRSDPHAFANLIAAHQVTTFRITPSLLDVFLTPATAPKWASVRAIFCSGEVLRTSVKDKVHQLLSTLLIGFYGATEAPGVAYHVYDRSGLPGSDRLYTPQEFASIEIRGPDGEAMSLGQRGEIWIGGLALAQGYWNRPDLTARNFRQVDGRRLYKTGDLGVWHPGGQFEILGRADMTEVNISGVRVNIPDVRDALNSLDGVTDTWVNVVSQKNGEDPVLIAHIVHKTQGIKFDGRGARAELTRLLPSAAVPAQFLVRDAFSLTSNGKLDIQALAKEAQSALDADRPRRGEGDAASTDLPPQAREVLPIVMACAHEVLGDAALSADADFFDLGGTSLQAVELSLLLSERLGADLSSAAIFNAASLADIAKTVAHGPTVVAGPLRLLREGTDAVAPVFSINSRRNYAELAKALSYQGAIYNLSIFGLTHKFIDRIEDISLNDLAQELAAEILAEHPTGPWRVTAFCQDGCLAVEIGRILQGRGTGPCELLLIDTFFLDHGPNLKMSLMRAIDFGPGYYVRQIAENLGFLRRIPSRKGETTPQQNAALFEKSKQDGQVYRRYMELFNAYNPPPYDGPSTLFVSTEWRFANLRAVKVMGGDDLPVVTFQGLHGSIFDAEHVYHLASAIDSVIDGSPSRGVSCTAQTA